MGSMNSSGCCCTATLTNDLPANAGAVSSLPDTAYAKKVEAVPILSRAVAETIQLQLQNKPLPVDYQLGELLEPHYIVDKLAYYSGHWLNGIPHGFGKMYYDDRCYYEGTFENGEPNAKEGLYVYPDGSCYRGQVRNAMANGKGKLTIAYGLMECEGEWKNDKMEGHGLERFRDGSYYEGQFKNGLKHGHGIFHWSNGTKYQGSFQEGAIEGLGTETKPDGTVLTGLFKQGRMQKPTTAPDYESRYSGQFFPIKLTASGSSKRLLPTHSPK